MKQLGFKPFRSFTENMGLTDIAQKPRVLSDHGQNKAQGKTQRGVITAIAHSQTRPSINSQNGQIFSHK